MARGYSKAKSESDIDVERGRLRMSEPRGIDAGEAITYDPVLKNAFTPEFKRKFLLGVDDAIGVAIDDERQRTERSYGGTRLKPQTFYLKIENEVYELKTREIEVGFEKGGNEIDQDFITADDIFDGSSIRSLSSGEAKKFEVDLEPPTRGGSNTYVIPPTESVKIMRMKKTQ